MDRTARIKAIAEALDNDDWGSRHDAERNLVAGTPAYWHTSSATTAAPGGLVQSANFHASMSAALDDFSDDWFAARGGVDRFLDMLIPLNEPAVTELSTLYVSVAGSFRSAHELRDRERRGVMGAWPAGRPSALVDWSVRKAAQQRWQRAQAEREAA